MSIKTVFIAASASGWMNNKEMLSGIQELTNN